MAAAVSRRAARDITPTMLFDVGPAGCILRLLPKLLLFRFFHFLYPYTRHSGEKREKLSEQVLQQHTYSINLKALYTKCI